LIFLKVHQHSTVALSLRILVLIAAAVAANWPSLWCELFPWDDAQYVAAASGLIQGTLAPWTPVLGNIHPLTMLSLSLDRLIGGGDPFVSHVMNLLLHSINAVLIFLLAKRMSKEVDMAWIVALIFAVHPLHVETVSWIAERKNLLFLLFSLSAALAYWNYLGSTPNRAGMVKVMLLFTLALLAKPHAVTLPMFLLGMALFHGGVQGLFARSKQLIPAFLLGLVFAGIALWAQDQGGYVHTSRDEGSAQHILLPALAFPQYGIRTLLPIGLSVIHPLPRSLELWHYLMLLSTGISLLLFVRAVQLGYREFPGLLLMYTASVLPIIQIIPFGSVLTADRYAYLASIPVLLGAMLGLRWLLQRIRLSGRLAFVGVGLLSLPLAYMTYSRSALWCEPLSLFKQAVVQYPESELAHTNLAAQYIKIEEFSLASDHLRSALNLDPNMVEALITSGQLEWRNQAPLNAIHLLTRAIDLAPDHPSISVAHYTRARALKETGDPASSLRDLDLLLSKEPDYGLGHYERGICLAMLNEHQAAIGDYNKAIELGVTDPDLPNNKAISLGWLGDYPAALRILDDLIEKNKASSESYFLRAIAKHRSGQDPCPDLELAMNMEHPMADEAIRTFCSDGVY